MIYLILSILSSIGIFIAFRVFSRMGANTRHAIMINYLVAAITGLAVFRPQELWFESKWFIPSAFLGIFFYIIFRVMAKVTQENGMSVSSIATKMSVVIPVAIGLTVLQESINAIKIIGIIFGLGSVVMSAGSNVKNGTWVWPLVLFIGSGLIDSALNLFQTLSVTEDEFPVFITNIFAFAFISAFVHQLFSEERKISFKSIAGGALLGLVNFSALIFILKSLALPNWESSIVFPINNFGIIAGSTLFAMVVFNEKVEIKGWLSIGLASCSIALLYYSK
jgi:multidrug transporter EmrE-like cation transporter